LSDIYCIQYKHFNSTQEAKLKLDEVYITLKFKRWIVQRLHLRFRCNLFS